MNIHQKLVEVRKSIGGFTKDKKSYSYSYVSGTQVLGKIQDKMNELGVLLIPSIIDQNFEKHEYTNSKGKDCLDFLVYGSMTYKWVNADDPDDCIEVPFYYTGAQDDVSKAFGSGLTYSERYFIIKFFNLPTDADDPDARDTSGNSARGGYNKQRTQMSQSTPSNNAGNNNLLSEKQGKMIFAKIQAIAIKRQTDGNVVYNEVMNNLGLSPSIPSNALTGAQASQVIGKLIELESR